MDRKILLLLTFLGALLVIPTFVSAYTFSAGGILELCQMTLLGAFMPHGHCYMWRSDLLTLHVGSDSLIALSYFTIPFALLTFARKRPEASFSKLFILFGAFIFLCGFTHLLAVYNVWHGAYWFSGVVKAATAIVSLITAIVLARSIPVALSIPLPHEYRRVTEQLKEETEGRSEAEKRLQARIGVDTEELWKSDSRWRKLIEFVCAAEWITDEKGMVTQAIPSWERFTGQTFEEYLGLGWLNAFMKSDRRVLRDEWLEAVKSAKSFEFEAHLWSESSNKYLPVLLKGIPIVDGEGAVHEWLGVIQDLSDIKRQETALASYSRRLHSKNKYLQEFAYAASHDLREPLRKIQNYGDILVEDHAAALPQEAREYVEVMQNASKRMTLLINDLLDYSKASMTDLNLSEFRFNDLMALVVSDLEVAIREVGAAIEYGDLGILQADAIQVQRVMQNIVGNAVKYSKKGGQPIVKIACSIVSRSDIDFPGVDFNHSQYYKIEVSDNGIGFDMKRGAKLFQPFQRLHSKSEYPGTGMGLAICKRIIERHSGYIDTKSEVGQGSTFIVYLPVPI